MSEIQQNWRVVVERKELGTGSYPEEELAIALTEAERNLVVSAILKTLAAVE